MLTKPTGTYFNDNFHFLLQGANLTLGLGFSDYSVSVGSAACQILEVFDNQLECVSNKVPDYGRNSDGTYSVEVIHVFFYKY